MNRSLYGALLASVSGWALLAQTSGAAAYDIVATTETHLYFLTGAAATLGSPAAASLYVPSGAVLTGDPYNAVSLLGTYAPVTLTNDGTILGGNNASGVTAYENQNHNSTIVNRGTIDLVDLHRSNRGVIINNNGGTIGGINSSSYGDTFTFNGGSIGNAGIAVQSSGTAPNVIFEGGATTISGDIGRVDNSSPTTYAPVSSLRINGGTISLDRDVDIHTYSSQFDNGTFSLGTHQLTYSSYGTTFSVGGTLKLRTTINANTGRHGYMSFENNYFLPGRIDTSCLTIIPVTVGVVRAGNRYVIFQDRGASGTTTGNLLPTVLSSRGYNWTVASVSGTGQVDTDGVSYGTGWNNIVITAIGTNSASSASGANGKGLSALATYSGSNAAMTDLSNAVNNLTSAAEIEKAGAQLRPPANGAPAQAAMGATGQALNTISIRADNVRAATADSGGGTGTGVSSGETLRGLGIWAQGFGSSATQDKRLGVDGYTADTYGLAFGADAKVLDPLRIGLSFAYARTIVDDAGSREGSGQKINSYIGTLYGTYTAERWYLDGAVTYGHHNYAGVRQINITGAAAQTAKSSYSGEQYGIKTELGVPFALGSNLVLTPLLGFAYNHLNQDAYTETGAAAALSVGKSATDSAKSSLGAKASTTVAQWGEWNVRPNARAIWSHEFNTKAHDQTSAYVDGGSSFTNTGTDTASESFTLGVGLDLASVRNTTISAKYDAGLSDRYVSHTGSLQARMEF